MAKVDLPKHEKKKKKSKRTVFKYDPKGNKIDRTLKKVAESLDKDIYVTSGDRSPDSKASRKNHSNQKARDIGTNSNPQLTTVDKENLAAQAVLDGLRVGTSKGHLHLDDRADERRKRIFTEDRDTSSSIYKRAKVADDDRRGLYNKAKDRGEPVKEQAIFGTDPVQTLKAIRKKKEARDASGDPNRNAPLDLTDPSEDDAMSGIDRIIQNTGASSDVARDPDSVQDDISIEVKKKEGEKLIKERPAAVKQIIKQVGAQQGADPKDIDGAIKNVDNISANRDKPSGNSISSQFTNALTFFLPSILGGLIGSIDSTEGALAGAETAQGLYGQFLDRGDKERQLAIQEGDFELRQEKAANEGKSLDDQIKMSNLQLRKQELEQQKKRDSNLQTDRVFRRDERDTQRAISAKESFGKRADVKKLKESIDAVGAIETLSVEGKKLPQATLALVARSISGEVGVLTDQDIKRSQINPDVISNLRRNFSLWTRGQLPQKDIDELVKVGRAIVKKKKQQIKGKAASFAESRSKDFSENIAKDFKQDLMIEHQLEDFDEKKSTDSSAVSIERQLDIIRRIKARRNQ